MKELVRHLLKNNKDEILNKSLLNCHIKGLHSIMLLDSPGKIIRMYITDVNHELYEKDALAFHPHHCDLTLHCIYNVFANHVVNFSNDHLLNPMNRYLYKSAIIVGGKGGFKFDGVDYFTKPKKTYVTQGSSIYLDADTIHNVTVPERNISAWIVFEGKENPLYESKAYSNKRIDKPETMDGLYIRPDYYKIVELLSSIGYM